MAQSLKAKPPILTLNCLISVGYHSKLRVAIALHQHYRFFCQLGYVIFVGVHTNYTKYDA